MSGTNSCVFCKIAQGHEPKTTILFQDEELVVFRDHRPAADHHYLIVTKTHIRDAKSLKKEHAPLIEKMVLVGKQLVQEQGGSVDDVRLGFHWPPAVLVHHFHMHIISPASQMGFMSRMLFRPDSYWFSTPEWLLKRLNSLPPEEDKAPPEK